MWRDAALVASRDLRIEARSRVALNQVAPFAVLVLVLFAFALDADRTLLRRTSPGLFWLAVVFSAVLAVQRSMAMEAGDGGDTLRLAGLDPAGVFLGKAGAVAVQLLGLQAVLAAGIVVLYGTELDGAVLLTVTCLVATAGLAAAGTVYGVVAAGGRARDTLLPLLALPVLAPVVLAATRASEAAVAGAAADGWPWLRLLSVFAVAYVAFGVVAFGALLDET